jgi:hypothetical protein
LLSDCKSTQVPSHSLDGEGQAIEQVPLTHCLPLGHALLQEPQFRLSELRFTQPPSHSLAGDTHEVAQLPAAQT